jgi:hypothetical protein
MRVLVLALMAALTGASQTTACPRPVVRPIEETGSLVGLQVAVDGANTPLYASRDGNRFYVEARKGGAYELTLTNRTGERVAVELTVDGLNVISGERDRPGPDRMYILGPWENTTIRGWRTSLEEVRRFTFVDEKVSYAARTGQANGKMGWIEMAVYRERRRVVTQPAPVPYAEEMKDDADASRAQDSAKLEKRQRSESAPRDASSARAGSAQAPAAEPSYPGTGWGDSLQDHVRLVDFDAESSPAQRLTVRYEYRSALVALGILPDRDRLSQRERGEYGFAKPPRW